MPAPSAAFPKVAWMNCNGTIACRSESNLQTIEYAHCPGAYPKYLTLEGIKAAIPELSKVVQFTEILETGPNGHIGTAELLLEGVKWIKSLDPNMPVVISHGTNLLADVAFILDVTLDRPGPVVMTGGMRPISALSEDGRYNFVQACAAAVHPSSRNRVVMILFSDRITPGFYGLKTSANRLDTFKSFEAGHLGLMNNLTPHFFYEPARPTGKPYFDIEEDMQDLPKVALIVCYIDMDLNEFQNKLDDKETKGVVIAGFGNVGSSFPCPDVHAKLLYLAGPQGKTAQASIWPTWIDKAVEMGAQNYPVVLTSLHPDSHTTPTYSTRNQIASGDLGPFKSYLLLRLAIAKYGQDVKKIRQVFGTDFAPVELPV